LIPSTAANSPFGDGNTVRRFSMEKNALIARKRL
jgi:hypothetical protein